MSHAFAVLLYAALATSSLALSYHGGHRYANQGEDDRRREIDSPYDYIIVGGGLTGLVVANRLSENPDANVLVLEYGDIDRSNMTQVPYYGTMLNTKDMFNITSSPEPYLSGNTFAVMAGAVAGGGSTVNAMALNRASAGDYDAWESLGNPGWGWEGLFPYFKKSAQFTPPPEEYVKEYMYTYDESLYGEDSPLQATFPLWQVPDTYTMFDGLTELGIPYIKDHAGGNAIGQFWVPSSIDARTQTRSSSLTAYYDAASSRPNLKMLTQHQVLHLTWEGDDIVSGVVAIHRTTGEQFGFHANKEIILAAGAIHTPQILQVSGIGPKHVVETVGIRSRIDLPGVGSNLQDHPVAYLDWEIENTFPPADILTKNATFAAEALEEYRNHLTGPYTKAQSTSIAFLSLSMITDDVESLVSITEGQSADSYIPENDLVAAGSEAQRRIIREQLKNGSVAALKFPFSGLGTMLVALEKPLSRGTIHINTSEPRDEPVVTFNALQDPLDRAQLFAFVEFTRKFFKTKAMASMNPSEVTPGADITTQEEVIAALNSKHALSPTFAHPSCSCPMMPEEKGGCVSPDLLVYGTKKLSIVDGSIIPIIPSAHLQASLYAVAEKAADIIKMRS